MVDWRASVLPAGGQTMVCWFSAPDAESRAPRCGDPGPRSRCGPAPFMSHRNLVTRTC